MRYALLLLPLALLSTVPQAQKARSRVGFVNVQQAVAAMPNSAGYLSLQKRVDADLKAKQANLQKLAAQAQKTRKAADAQAYQKAQQSLVTAQRNHDTRLAKEFKPLQTRLNSVVASVARGSGFTVVLDRRVAAQSGVVVYANTSATDLTPAVVKALKK
ncbi:OmpH family outer membrane protein [Deinococcus sp. SDU3-2]|uniref:OmpH family outer membrane protein n=1 Tax=Deinococcus terrestris TaxID=2651870 RepID=A0A7X1TR67_9DEIO|nr:OmpH family outer membrane protein [Deinococcus terrestris]MPY66084.1 OmpH family outer membrane protein [Deinococcus terrestris]